MSAGFSSGRIRQFTLARARCGSAFEACPPSSTLGIISDIDDTVIVTDSHSPWKMLPKVFLNNAHSRHTITGVPEWYARLTQQGARPIFYVSSSPWNLYDTLLHLFDLQHVVQGTMILRDYGIEKDKLLLGAHLAHKRAAIDKIMATYPAMQFILLGDTAQHDPTIYYGAAKDYGNRIAAFYFRDIGIPRLAAPVMLLAQTAQSEGIDMLVIRATHEGVAHSTAHGFIA